MTGTIVWVHGDNLSPRNPALAAHSGSLAIFVFDDEYLKTQKISLKRVMFMYECLMELPVTIRRGDVAERLLEFAEENGATGIVTLDSVSPRFAAVCDILRKRLQSPDHLVVMPSEPFVSYQGELDLKRFSRYWSAIRDLAMRKQGKS